MELRVSVTAGGAAVSKPVAAACHPHLCPLRARLLAWCPTYTQSNRKGRFRDAVVTSAEAFRAFPICLNNWKAKRHPSAQLLAHDGWTKNSWTSYSSGACERPRRISPSICHRGPSVTVAFQAPVKQMRSPCRFIQLRQSLFRISVWEWIDHSTTLPPLLIN